MPIKKFKKNSLTLEPTGTVHYTAMEYTDKCTLCVCYT